MGVGPSTPHSINLHLTAMSGKLPLTVASTLAGYQVSKDHLYPTLSRVQSILIAADQNQNKGHKSCANGLVELPGTPPTKGWHGEGPPASGNTVHELSLYSLTEPFMYSPVGHITMWWQPVLRNLSLHLRLQCRAMTYNKRGESLVFAKGRGRVLA